MATSSWDPDSALLRCPKLHELDLISGNQKTVRVFEGTASKWERIALRLHFDGNTISQIRTDSQYNQLRACQNVFTEWLSGKEGLRTPRTWSTVVQVLQEANLGQLADELKYVLGATSIRARHTAEGSSDSLNPAERMFPFLQSKGMTSEDYEKLQTRLYSESVDIAGAFGVTFNAFFQSLKEREISIKEVVATLKAFGAFTPVYKGENQPLLRDELNCLDLTTASIHDVRLIILDYCSFFNYRLFEFLVGAHGTPKDKQKLQQHEAEFNEYAKRRVFECPPELGKPTDKFNINIVIKLDDHYEGCTLNQLKLLEADFCKILHVTNLKLCHVAPGCLQLTFQLPQFIAKQIFPLSTQQEHELLALHVVSVMCGDCDICLTRNLKEKILILEAKLQECSMKINDIQRQLEMNRYTERQLERKKEKIPRVRDETKTKMETRIAECTTAEQLSSEKPPLMPVKGREGQNRKFEDTKLSFEAKQTKATVAMQQKYEENLIENQTEMDENLIENQTEMDLYVYYDSTLKIHSEQLEIMTEVATLQLELWKTKIKVGILEDIHIADALKKKVAEIENKIQQLHTRIGSLLHQMYEESTPSIDLGAHSKSDDQH